MTEPNPQDLGHRFAYLIFGDIWLALSVQCRVSAQKVERLALQYRDEFNWDGATQPAINLTWVLDFCKEHGITVSKTGNLTLPACVKSSERKLNTGKEYNEIRRFFNNFLSEDYRRRSNAFRQQYDEDLMRQFCIIRATETTENFIAEGIYYPRWVGISSIFRPWGNEYYFRIMKFLMHIAAVNPFLVSLNPPFLEIISDVLLELSLPEPIEDASLQQDSPSEPYHQSQHSQILIEPSGQLQDTSEVDLLKLPLIQRTDESELLRQETRNPLDDPSPLEKIYKFHYLDESKKSSKRVEEATMMQEGSEDRPAKILRL